MGKRRVRISEKVVFAWFLIAGLTLLLVPRGLTSKLQFAFARTFRDQLAFARELSFAAKVSASDEDTISPEQYQKLRNHLANVSQSLNQEREKVQKLSGFSDRSFWNGMHFILADVITSAVDGSRSELIINRGKSDGLVPGNYVISNYSVVGIISEAASHTARVRLITDPRSRIPVKIERADVNAVMKGQGDNSATIMMLQKKHHVNKDDVIYAKKIPGLLDVPVIIAKVTYCKADAQNPLFWDLKAEPATNIKNLKEVAVIMYDPPEND